MNKLVVSGVVKKLEPLRYTPAGLPLISFLIDHVSETIEAGLKRQVSCEIPAIIMGDLAKHPLTEGGQIKAAGFLAKRSAKSAQLVMHIQNIQII